MTQENDGDSVYSQARYRLPIPTFMGEVTVVSKLYIYLETFEKFFPQIFVQSMHSSVQSTFPIGNPQVFPAKC